MPTAKRPPRTHKAIQPPPYDNVYKDDRESEFIVNGHRLTLVKTSGMDKSECVMEMDNAIPPDADRFTSPEIQRETEAQGARLMRLVFVIAVLATLALCLRGTLL